MGDALESQMEEVMISDGTTYERTPFGKEMLKHFMFDPSYKNLNHGSFGTFPRVIQKKQREYLDMCESAPDPFIRTTYFQHLQHSRNAISKLLSCPGDTVVFVPNATTGVNTVLRNIVWNADGKDEVLYFRHIYGACLKTIEYVCEANRDIVGRREIVVDYPMEDADLLDLFRATIKASRDAGKTPRLAIYDSISSLPGLRMPFEDLTAICKQEGVLSLIDGAHGVGHIPIDLSAVDPDFFVSNCHKWLFLPRGNAVMYVPVRNQALMRTTLPTSHGFVPRGESAGSPVRTHSESPFLAQFDYTGTIDNTSYLMVPEAIKWRQEVCGGEKAIMDYNINLAHAGGQAVAKILGTEVLDNATHTLTNCCLVNVLLPMKTSPVKIAGESTVHPDHETQVIHFMQDTIKEEYKSFLPIYSFQGRWWTRLSGQIYLDVSDFEWAGNMLKAICERVGREEFL